MRFLPLQGDKPINKNYSKYLINWAGKSRSNYQFKVKDFLSKYWSYNIVYEEFPIIRSRMTLDIYNATNRTAIEVQGEFHSQYSEWAHKGNTQNYLNQIKRDFSKRAWCEKNEINLIEIFPEDVSNLNKEFFERLGVIL